MSDLDGRLIFPWPNTVKLAKLADEMEFEALVPVARWAGFGGATNPQGPGFESYTWASGIAASTQKAGVLSTSHVMLNHPMMAAKQGAAIDHISGGRFTLNIVAGWNGPEMEMFGLPLQGHDERYDCAEEWITIVKRLWSEDDTFDFHGRFYNIKKGYLQPKPIQSAYPAIMNAGGSERGRHFAAKHCDLVFTVIRTGELDECRAHVQAYHTMAREELRPRDQGLDAGQFVQGETEKEARDFYNYYVHAAGDWEAASTWSRLSRRDERAQRVRRSGSSRCRRCSSRAGAASGGRHQGAVVDALLDVVAAGLDGLLVACPASSKACANSAT